jgi:hypothetical protein
MSNGSLSGNFPSLPSVLQIPRYQTRLTPLSTLDIKKQPHAPTHPSGASSVTNHFLGNVLLEDLYRTRPLPPRKAPEVQTAPFTPQKKWQFSGNSRPRPCVFWSFPTSPQMPTTRPILGFGASKAKRRAVGA